MKGQCAPRYGLRTNTQLIKLTKRLAMTSHRKITEHDDTCHLHLHWKPNESGVSRNTFNREAGEKRHSENRMGRKTMAAGSLLLSGAEEKKTSPNHALAHSTGGK